MGWRSMFWLVVFVLLIFGTGFLVYFKYPLLFSETVEGRVIGVSRVSGEAEDHFVVAIRIRTGRIYSAKASDARWALVNPGQCAEARFFPFPPWNLENRGSYEKAMLLNPKDCGPQDGAMPAIDESPLPGAPDPISDHKPLLDMDIPPPPMDGPKEKSP